MYGKSLEDFPDKFNGFTDALSDLSDAEINGGFEWALRHLPEFPTPAHIRDCATLAVKENRQKLTDEAARNQRLLEDKIKYSRFDETTAEERREEFAAMVAKAAQRLA
jgi:hypothetical protein